jgi:hypothetical protein
MKKSLFYLIILLAFTNAFYNCKLSEKIDPPPVDLADSFVGNYYGGYLEMQGNSGLGFKGTAIVSKKGSSEVLIHIDHVINKNSVDLKGFAKNDTLLEIPIQTINGQPLNEAGTAVITYKLNEEDTCLTDNIDPKALKFKLKYKLKSSSSNIINVHYIGVK